MNKGDLGIILLISGGIIVGIGLITGVVALITWTVKTVWGS